MKGKVAPAAKAVLKPPPPPTRLRCPGISRLPKSPLPRGLTYAYQTPGVPLKLIARPATGQYLDPAHPAVKAFERKSSSPGKPFQFLKYDSPTGSFAMYAAPNAFLFEPDKRWYPYFDLSFEKWEDRIERQRKRLLGEHSSHSPDIPNGSSSSLSDGYSRLEGLKEKQSRKYGASGDSELEAVNRILARRTAVLSKAVPISLRFATNKAKMGGKPFYAGQVRKRVRNAIRLIVTHGANGIEKKRNDMDLSNDDTAVAQETKVSRRKIVHDLEEVKQRMGIPGNAWILKEWTYLIFPTMYLYRMPIPDLVWELRQALESMYGKGQEWEKTWLHDAEKQSLEPQRPRRVNERPRMGNRTP